MKNLELLRIMDSLIKSKLYKNDFISYAIRGRKIYNVNFLECRYQI